MVIWKGIAWGTTESLQRGRLLPLTGVGPLLFYGLFGRSALGIAQTRPQWACAPERAKLFFMICRSSY